LAAYKIGCPAIALRFLFERTKTKPVKNQLFKFTKTKNMTDDHIKVGRMPSIHHGRHIEPDLWDGFTVLSPYCYAHINGKLVDLISPDEIDEFLEYYYPNTKNTSISRAYADEHPMLDLNFVNNDPHAEYLVFENTAIKITADSIELIPQHEMPFYVLNSLTIYNRQVSQTIMHMFTLEQSPVEIYRDNGIFIKNNDPEFVYTQFLIDLAAIHWQKDADLTHDESQQQNRLFAQLLLTIGYLAAQYKQKDYNPVTFILDKNSGDNGFSKGRSGKSTFMHALSYVRPYLYLSGRNAGQNIDQFMYQFISSFNDCIHVDDLHPETDISRFASLSDETFTYQPYPNGLATLQFEQVGKLAVSACFKPDVSNLPGTHNCCYLSDYYHEANIHTVYTESRSPFTKFGKMLYHDFTYNEWNKFYNLIAYCLQLHLIFERKTLKS